MPTTASTKNYSPAAIIQGPGQAWAIGTAPTDANVRLTLASDGTPDATAHPGSVHLGAIATAISTTVKPKMTQIQLDQYDAPFATYVDELAASIEAEMAQMESSLVQRALGVGVYGSGAGYEYVTFGGVLTVPKTCIAVISPTRADATKYIVSVLYNAVSTGGFSVQLGKAKPAFYKAKFEGLSDTTRTAGKQIGVIYQTLASAAGGTPTAMDAVVSQIYEGPVDLWILGTAPTDSAIQVTLDTATMTPDATTHGVCTHLGIASGATTFSVAPKIETIKGDQFDGPIDAWVSTVSAKLEVELTQASMQMLANTLGVGTYATSAGAYSQTTYGGTMQQSQICVAAIGKKRTDATKAVCACLYAVNTTDGIVLTASRKKPSFWKATFEGLLDPTRTLGRQMGIFQEMV